MAQQLKTGTLTFTLDLENNQLMVQDGPAGYSFDWLLIKDYINGTQSLRLTEVLVQVVERLINRGTDLNNATAVKTDLEQVVFKLLN